MIDFQRSTPEYPLVSIILPIRNEARHIARCLDGVLTQDYERDKIEVLAVDGMSMDGTREIIARISAQDARVRLVDNPERFVPTALNRGIRLSRGAVVIRVDGHAIIARDYVRRCIDDLARVEADCVGGPIRTIGETWMAAGIAIAQSSPFGVGNAAFRYAARAQFVDTLAFGAYRRGVFDRIGLFDEELVRNQDDEFNFRLVRSGGKIWLDPAIRSDYFSRASLQALWTQYLEYGFWKVRVIQKHGRPASWRHLVPGAFVLTLLLSATFGALFNLPFPFLGIVVSYIFVSLAFSLKLAVRKGLGCLPILPLAFATMHLAYGVGFILGLVRFGIRRPTFAIPQRRRTV